MGARAVGTWEDWPGRAPAGHEGGLGLQGRPSLSLFHTLLASCLVSPRLSASLRVSPRPSTSVLVSLHFSLLLSPRLSLNA